MSFFGGGDPFGFGDPFFGDMPRQMHRQMQDMDRMMTGLMDPFGFGGMFGESSQGGRNLNPRQQMIADGGGPSQSMVRHQDPMGGMMMPFGFGGGLLGGGLLSGMMRQMDQMQQHAMQDPNAHMYTHSTVISFDGTGSQPKYYESTNSVRKAGDVKEERKTVRNTATGEERMSVGHTIGDRTHVIEKKRDRDGRIREQQRFVNLDQGEAQQFDREFGERVGRSGSTGRNRRRIANPRSAISNAPIVTVPDDDEPTIIPIEQPSSRHRRDGPIIEEI